MANTALIIILCIIAFVVCIILISFPPSNYNPLTTIGVHTTILVRGSQSNPFQPNSNNTLTWQGPGYYLIPSNIPASGLKQGVNQLSVKEQVDGYNQWVPSTTSTTSIGTTISSTLSTIHTTTHTTTVSQTAQNNVWATQFFENVSSIRGSQYHYCPTLSDFAQTRFNTMVANYGVTHYGYEQDFNKYWPNGYTYDNIIYTGFGEEVFYPGSYNINDFINYIITQAPLHWQGLVDKNLTYYGYYIASGPTYEIFGPGGGYGPLCSVTELPGPGINITQFFAQYGCSVEATNLKWFVIEIAQVCP